MYLVILYFYFSQLGMFEAKINDDLSSDISTEYFTYNKMSHLLTCKASRSHYYRGGPDIVLLAQTPSGVVEDIYKFLKLKRPGLIYIMCRNIANSKARGIDFNLVNVTQSKNGSFFIDWINTSPNNQPEPLNPVVDSVLIKRKLELSLIIKCSFEFPFKEIQNLSMFKVDETGRKEILMLSYSKFKVNFISNNSRIKVEYEEEVSYNRKSVLTSYTCEVFHQYKDYRTTKSVNSGPIPLLEAVRKEDLMQDEVITLSEWSPWSSCRKEICGRGIRRRWRNCKSQKNILKSKCLFENTNDIGYCPQTNCPHFWSFWSDWENCYESCYDSVWKRVRECNYLGYSVRPPCQGPSVEFRKYSKECNQRATLLSDCERIKSTTCINAPSGVYTVEALSSTDNGLQIFCDMETRQKAWIVIQRRTSSDVSFARSWLNYKEGFGQLDNDFWFGNENLYLLTKNRPMTIRIDLWYANKTHRFAEYDQFSVASEEYFYQIRIEKYFGNAGDCLSSLNNSRFSTVDFNLNDRHNDSCQTNISNRTEGFWMSNCTKTNLNGIYNPFGKQLGANSIFWCTFGKTEDAIEKVEMKLKY